MKRDRGGRARGGWTVALRAAACLLVAVIVADVLTDSACDDISIISSASGPVVQGSDPRGGSEACADFCVPDCFCCSRSVAAGTPFVPAKPQPLIPVDAPPAEHGSAGVLSAVDHPPLSRA